MIHVVLGTHIAHPDGARVLPNTAPMRSPTRSEMCGSIRPRAGFRTRAAPVMHSVVRSM